MIILPAKEYLWQCGAGGWGSGGAGAAGAGSEGDRDWRVIRVRRLRLAGRDEVEILSPVPDVRGTPGLPGTGD